MGDKTRAARRISPSTCSQDPLDTDANAGSADAQYVNAAILSDRQTTPTLIVKSGVCNCSPNAVREGRVGNQNTATKHP